MRKGRAEEIFRVIQLEGVKALDRYIQDNKTEELYLDFKRSADHGHKTKLHPTDLENYGKAISGFANSSGGVIVWGVDCHKLDDGADVASAKVPISNPRRFVSWLENATSGRTLPAHDGVIHHCIEASSGGGFVVTLIPQSDIAPHQDIGTGHYLMRAGSNFCRVPHGVLEGFFGRRPQAKIVHKFLMKAAKFCNGKIRIELGISLRNEGLGLGKFHGFLMIKI